MEQLEWFNVAVLDSRELYYWLQLSILRCYFRFSLVLLCGVRCQGGFLSFS